MTNMSETYESLKHWICHCDEINPFEIISFEIFPFFLSILKSLFQGFQVEGDERIKRIINNSIIQ